MAGSSSYGAPWAKTSSVKGMARLGVLTRVWSGRGHDAGGAGGVIRQRSRAELRGWAAAVVLRALDPLESKCRGSVEGERGQEGQECQRRR